MIWFIFPCSECKSRYCVRESRIFCRIFADRCDDFEDVGFHQAGSISKVVVGSDLNVLIASSANS